MKKELRTPRYRISILVNFFISFFILCTFSAQADKVKIDSSEWGKEGGEECISCHKKTSRGLAAQWQESAHGKVGMHCLDCHQADVGDDDAITHEGEVIATVVSPEDCGRCHVAEYEQQKGSVHANAAWIIRDRIPAMENIAGAAIVAGGCDQCHGSTVKLKGDGKLDPATWPNSGIGRINPDGSKGSCTSCHGRHSFS